MDDFVLQYKRRNVHKIHVKQGGICKKGYSNLNAEHSSFAAIILFTKLTNRIAKISTLNPFELEIIVHAHLVGIGAFSETDFCELFVCAL